MGIFLACNLGFLVYMLVRTPKLNKPLTAAETLKAAPAFNANLLRKPRLTSRGKVIVVMAAAFGVVAALVSWALSLRIASTGLNQAALPAAFTIFLVDLVPVGFVLLLHRTNKILGPVLRLFGWERSGYPREFAS